MFSLPLRSAGSAWRAVYAPRCTSLSAAVSFLRADTGKPVSGNNKGSMLLILNPFTSHFSITGHVSRDTLMATGRKLLSDREPADERAA
uniref:DNA N-6-adenine-methyltransferase n=1 Tax=Pantoea sp. Nvir TaxID=2576760 RepID=UPI0030D1D467